VLDGVFEPLPDLEIAGKFRLLVGEFLVRVVGRLLRIHRPVARVLHGQAAAMISTSVRQALSRPARIMRPTRGSSGRRASCLPSGVSG
jgi:hypothetical protein